jgi:hypothetical protein
VNVLCVHVLKRRVIICEQNRGKCEIIIRLRFENSRARCEREMADERSRLVRNVSAKCISVSGSSSSSSSAVMVVVVVILVVVEALVIDVVVAVTVVVW